MVLTWEEVGVAYKRRKMKDRQESTEGSKQACVPELHNGCGTDTHVSWPNLHSSFSPPRSSIHALPPNSCLILRSTTQ
jgi:hypothetical protein